jgi:type IV pilus assembly protein PilC
MKSYQYIARDLSGAKKIGYSQAASTSDVLDWLNDQGFTPVSVSEVSAGANKKKGQSRTKARRKRIKSADMSALCWQLTTMVEGGIVITTALETIAEDIENKFLAGGTLAASLRRLAEYYDNRDKLAKKVKGATAYPVFVLTFIVAIVVFIMAFIIPRFKVIFDQFGGELPAFTQAFMNFYDFLRHNLLLLIGGTMFVILMAVFAYTKTRKGHYVFSKMMLRLPMLGGIYSQAFIATFCTTMSTLLNAGVSVLEVFDMLSGMTSNDIIKDAVISTRERVVGGLNIHLSMTESGFFPNLVIKMIQVGEESGSLSRVLERTAAYYERKVDSTITTLMSLLEPVMIITVGAIVLVIVLALYLPIFTMSDVTG